MIINNPKNRYKRKVLRKQTTETETLIWTKIRRKQLGFIFYRQTNIGPYFVDFYCPAKRLVVEVDGSQHNNKENQEYDQYRTKYLNSLNITVLRFWNIEVLNSLNKVIEVIWNRLHEE